MIGTFRPSKIESKHYPGPGRPKMTEEEKEIARIERLSVRFNEQTRKALPRKNKLRLLKAPFIQFSEQPGQKFKGKVINTMNKEEAIEACNYLVQALNAKNIKKHC